MSLGWVVALKAFKVEVREAWGLAGCCWGRKANLHSLEPLNLRQPVRMTLPFGLLTVTVDLENVTKQLASQKLPIPMRVCLNKGMT